MFSGRLCFFVPTADWVSWRVAAWWLGRALYGVSFRCVGGEETLRGVALGGEILCGGRTRIVVGEE